MSDFYSLVEDGAIQRINTQLPAVINGTSIPQGATGLDQFGIYPIVGDEPQYDPSTHRVSGPIYEFDGNAVKRIYAVEAIPAEELAAAALAKAKEDRKAEVDALTVTTGSGKTFDGDETSQTRMARAILALQATNTPEIMWVLADNTPALVTVGEIVEALVLAGAKQAEIWVRPYQ